MNQWSQLPVSREPVEEIWPENAQWPDGTELPTHIRRIFGSKDGQIPQMQPDEMPMTFYFGVEFEILFKPRVEFSRWDQAISHLVGVLRDGEVRCILLDDDLLYRLRSEGRNIPYREWLLTADSSLERDNDDNVWGIEIISAVCDSLSQVWRDEFGLIWRHLLKNFQLQQSPKCGTHIHISAWPTFTSPKPHKSLRRLAKAIIYFERCIDALMPPQRLIQDFYCKSNRWNLKLRGHDVKQIFKMIDRARTLKELIELMCYDKNSGSNKLFKWNFEPLKDFKGTIEFRQPPGSTTQQDALVWPNFAQAFVTCAMETSWFRGSTSNGYESELHHPPTIKHLDMMMIRHPGVWKQLLEDKSELEELTLEGVLAAEMTSANQSHQAFRDTTQDCAERQAHEDMKWSRITNALGNLSL